MTEIERIEGQRLRLGVFIGSSTSIRCGWYRDGMAIPGADLPVLDLGRIQWGQSGVYQVRVTNDLGWVEGPLIQVRVSLGATHPGSVDGTFHAATIETQEPGLVAPTWMSGVVSLGDQAYVHGAFERYDEHPSRHVARVKLDGRVDAGFVWMRDDPRLASAAEVDQWIPLMDGRFAANVRFATEGTSPNNGRRYSLLAFRNDGSVDPGFTPDARPSSRIFSYGPMAAAIEGGLWVSGWFLEWIDSGERVSLARLRSDGSRDSDFPGVYRPTHSPAAMVGQPDGKVIVAWQALTDVGSLEVKRYTANGSEDPLFQVDASGWQTISFMAIDREGRLLLAPSAPPGLVVPLLSRCLPDGRRDPGFQLELEPDWPGALRANGLGIQSDGRIVVGLAASGSGATTFPPPVARWDADGGLDPGFRLSDSERVSPFGRGLAVVVGDGLLMAANRGDALVRINAHDERSLGSPRTSGHLFQATVSTRIGRRYSVLAASEAGSKEWQTTASFSGDGHPRVIQEPMGALRFFRLRLDEEAFTTTGVAR